MKSIVEQLAMYSCYHRDGRNVVTHMIGIPLIIVSLLALLSRPEWIVGYVFITPAIVITVIGVIYYSMLDTVLGLIMAAILALCIWLASWIAALSTQMWLAVGISFFIVGWILQFVGHAYEGRKPAFVDDIMGLVIGPLFVVAELIFLLGFNKPLYLAVENRVAELLPKMPLASKRRN